MIYNDYLDVINVLIVELMPYNQMKRSRDLTVFIKVDHYIINKSLTLQLRQIMLLSNSVYLFSIPVYYHSKMGLLIPNEDNKGHEILS